MSSHGYRKMKALDSNRNFKIWKLALAQRKVLRTSSLTCSKVQEGNCRTVKLHLSKSCPIKLGCKCSNKYE